MGARDVSRILPYVSFQGRANRQAYWLTALSLLGGMLLASFLVYAVPVAGIAMAGLVYLLCLAAGLSVAVRRLHDRGKSGWWLLPMYLPLILFSALGALVEVSQGEPNVVFSTLTLPFSIWILVELGCLRGTVGPNRFGPDPRLVDDRYEQGP